jgi:hypothetical protein
VGGAADAGHGVSAKEADAAQTLAAAKTAIGIHYSFLQ